MFSQSVNMPEYPARPRRPGPLADLALLAFGHALYVALALVGLGVALGRRKGATGSVCDLKPSRN